eukprot:9355240-Pyramimonas_sp.AAC.1
MVHPPAVAGAWLKYYCEGRASPRSDRQRVRARLSLARAYRCPSPYSTYRPPLAMAHVDAKSLPTDKIH